VLTGIHLLRSGEVEASLPALLAERNEPAVQDLLNRKTNGSEKEPLELEDEATHAPRLVRLATELEDAFHASGLPEEVTNFDQLNDFVVRARREFGA
jgi:hypothetical protein